jgi:hypothetical protein
MPLLALNGRTLIEDHRRKWKRRLSFLDFLVTTKRLIQVLCTSQSN